MKHELRIMKNGLIVAIMVFGVIICGVYIRSQKSAIIHNPSFIRIGGAFGLSGVCAEWGEGEKKAAEMAVSEINARGGINGRQIEFIVEDTQCDNKGTVNAVNKLIHANGVQALIGPTWGDAYQGASPVIREARVPAISPDTAMEALEFQNQPIDFIFSSYPPQRAEIAALQNYAQSKNIRRVAMVWDQDSYSTMMMRLFKEAAPAHDITLIEEHEMPTGNQDFRTIIAKMKTNKPDAVFISFLAPHTKASFVKQAKELSLGATILSAADIQDASVLESFGDFMEGIIYTYPKTQGAQAAFVAAYKAMYNNEDPQGPAAVNAYDAVRSMAEAIKRAGDGADGAAIQEKLLSITIPGTFISELNFNEKHQVHGGDFEVITVTGGAFVPLNQ